MKILLDLPKLSNSQLDITFKDNGKVVEVRRNAVGTVRLSVLSESTAKDLVLCQPYDVMDSAAATLVLAPYLYKGIEFFGMTGIIEGVG
ncbi:hypothetical protein AD45P2_00165 [Alteromonas phage vB_AmaP_AD45-P2]|uniref:Uncharacterized protein n=1 Tax=Pseudorhizobium pelagicum TaxID=1509405 RepID=A0A922P281_9HYPH|nr:hypothetical protein [Pseudorhizobium pelagicum]YP_008126005.1 hypothetical protein M610_gp034 [Alteromonas phage vB_AmaP_AD45-P1]AGM46972.1 hypothetical protein AD45P3_00170 [Alteromonas phage vB_AmaP_AD45-P3]AGM47089.1 hypothetical protein AD45P4_00170 [Alteromonas phage vB_AmaP_AD45-P4]AGM47204.1 hypothetical protein AD45P2_00165 [Alteromonas phage vB_AmaP_AD45-P2]AGM46852.1 hypothetical protein AD45P1_00170 [Alteromonas phage vB_AmaP_AD45-P1]KEQ05558.1 hypothetical protein GV68_08490 [